MKNDVQIENFYEEGGMEPAKNILSREGIALVAVGSSACIRSLYFTAREMERLDALFWRIVTRRDYSLGKQETAIQECVQEALARTEVKGVIIYASCMDILTGLEENAVIDGLDNPKEVPVEILYRGPLTKRKGSPMKELELIWKRWGMAEMSLGNGKEKGIYEKRQIPPPPDAPDFETAIERILSEDCDILLLTPGGCKSCMTCQKEKRYFRAKNTRFSDLSLWNCNIEELAELILQNFPGNKRLYLFGSIVTEAAGFDMEELCFLLRGKGKDVIHGTI